MNSRAEFIAPALSYPSIEDSTASQAQIVVPRMSQFADEQIRSLVRQVFSPGWPRPVRQAVFSSVDASGGQVRELCQRVGQELSEQVSGPVCIVEADQENAVDKCGRTAEPSATAKCRPGEIRQSSRQIGGNLWLTTGEVFYQGAPGILSVSWLRNRLAHLRLDFEYALLQARPASQYSDAALLGSLSGGVILVLQANLTRRGAAQKVTETLRAANAHVLGTVLSNRSFPIPERIYRKL